MIRGVLFSGALSAALFLALSYPLAARFFSGVFAIPEWPFDTYGTLYGIWWSEYALGHGVADGVNRLLAHPFGLDWSHLPPQPMLSLPLLAFSLLGGEIFAYNLFAVVNFALTGAAAYALFYYCTGHPRGSLLGALIYTFSSNHLIQTMTHLGFSALQWIPLFILAWLYLWEKRTWKGAVFCAAAACLLFWSNFYFFYFSLFFIPCFFAIAFAHRRVIPWKGMGKLLAASGLLAGALASPQIVPVFQRAIQEEKGAEIVASGYVRSPKDLKKYAARPSDYLLPSEHHPVFGPAVSWLQQKGVFKPRHWSDRTLYLGGFALTVAPMIFLFRRRVSPRDRFLLWLTWVCALFFLWLSTAPRLLTSFLYPVFPMFRFYCRAGFLVSLFLSLAVAYVWKYHAVQFSTARAKNGVCAAAAVLILFDFAVVPPARHLDLSKTPPVYAWLKEQPGDFAVVEYPFPRAIEERQQRYMFWSRLHGKKLVNGGDEGTLADALRKFAQETGNPRMWSLLKYFGVRYVLVHGAAAGFDANPSLKLARDFGESKAFEIVAAPQKLYSLLWHFGQSETGPDGRPGWRWVARNAKIWCLNPGEKPVLAQLSLQLWAPQPNTLEVRLNGAAIAGWQPGGERKISLILPPGENLIELIPEKMLPHPAEKNRQISFRLFQPELSPK